MSFRTGNILGGKPLIEIDRGVDLLHDRIGTGGKTPAPHLVAHLGSCQRNVG